MAKKYSQNEKTPYGVCFTPALTGCPPAVYRIDNIIYNAQIIFKNFPDSHP
jgi:hypothetical protein